MKSFLKILCFLALLAPVFALAQGYKPLVGIPGVDDNQNFDQYLQAVYATAISLAALMAVIKIVIAGVKWMTSDIVSTIGDAKNDIRGAVLGLIVILSAVLILYIINPDIGAVNLNLTAPPAASNFGSSNSGSSATPAVSIPVSYGPGYSFIPTNASQSVRSRFDANCNGTIRVVGTERRCHELLVADEARIRADFTGAPNPPSAAILDGVINQYKYSINPFLVTDTASIDNIISQNGADGAYFIMEARPAHLSAAGEVCKTYARANGHGDGFVIGNRGSNYYACLY